MAKKSSLPPKVTSKAEEVKTMIVATATFLGKVLSNTEVDTILDLLKKWKKNRAGKKPTSRERFLKEHGVNRKTKVIFEEVLDLQTAPIFLAML